MRIEYHRTLIADTVRNLALKRALDAVITPGVTTVADIGAGTGFIGLMASKLGAAHVMLYEQDEGLATVAARTLKDNRAKACQLMPCHSATIIDPPRVDVVVSETLGNYALEEDIIATLNDARTRHLKPGGVLIPCAITQFVAPVISDRVARELGVWEQAGPALGLPLDLSAAAGLSVNNAYVRSFKPAELLPDGERQWDAIDLTRAAKANRRGACSWSMSDTAAIHGFAAWWSAELVPGVTLSTSPHAPATHWEQLYFPLMRPLLASPGDSVSLAIATRTTQAEGTHMAWTVTHSDAAGTPRSRQAMDLNKGYLP